MLLLQCMQKLNYIDPEYKLFFAGIFQNPMLEQYIKHIVQQLELTDVVFFDGWQEDVNICEVALVAPQVCDDADALFQDSISF